MSGRQLIYRLHFFLLLLISCTVSPPTSNTSGKLNLQPGFQPFKINSEVNELTLAKFDPVNGDRWMTILRHDLTGWIFSSPPSDKVLLDKQANELFITHLIDTFKNIRIEAVAPKGSLESLGLDPPHYAIRWKSAETGFEFRVGTALKNQTEYYFTLDGINAFIASGITFKMLNLIDSFDYLRRSTWSFLPADQIVEIQFRSRGKNLLYTQRDGDTWTDTHHRPLKKEINPFLKELTSAQIEKFIDNEEEATKIYPLLQIRPLYEVECTDWKERKTFFKLTKINNQLYGTNSTRPGSVFVLNTKFLRLFEKLLN